MRGFVDTAGTAATATQVGEHTFAMGNLNQHMYGQTVMALALTSYPHPNPCANAVLLSGQSIGSVISLVESGVGMATASSAPSVVFFGL